jgi:glycerol-3-phosphate acyltransferase PlsY
MTATMIVWVVAGAVAAYLCGSISSAVLVCRFAGLPDPRGEGSGNPGATNVLRIGGKGPALATLAGDFLKGWLPVAVAGMLDAPASVLAAAIVCAFAGHLYPVFFGFKGGKGVATALGAITGLSLWLGLASAASWLLAAAVTRISSASSLVTAMAVPVYTWFLTRDWLLVGATLLLTALQFWRHRGNIRNLLSGQEPRIGASRRKQSSA